MSDRPDGSPTSVDVILRADWAPQIGTDKDLTAPAFSVGFGGFADLTYVPPADKMLLITDVVGSMVADAVADAEKSNMMEVVIVVAGGDSIRIGGNGGAAMPWRKPIVVPPSTAVDVIVYNMSGHTCSGRVTAHGYEVPV